MAFNDRFGSTTIIRAQHDNLSIAWEFNEATQEKHPVLLFIPDMEKSAHFNIPLTEDAAIRLHNWLAEYLNDKTYGKLAKGPPK